MSHRAASVASRAIELALRGEHFTTTDIRRGVDDAPSRSTIYRVLDDLEGDDWIAQRGNGWVPGMKATMLGDAPDSDSEITLDAGDVLG